MMSSAHGTYGAPHRDPFGWISSTGQPRRSVASGPFSTTAMAMMTAVAVLGLALTCYLSWVSLTSGKVAGCGSGGVFDCSHVMRTKWSRVFGVPVGVPAAMTYVFLIGSLGTAFLTRSQTVRHTAYSLASVAAFAAALAAVWFVLLQVFVVEHLCGYCLAAHACGLTLAALVMWNSPLSMTRMAGLFGLSVIGVSSMAIAQAMAEPPPTFEIETHPVVSTPIGHESDSFEGEIFAAPGVPAEEAASSAPSGSSNSLDVFEAPIFEAPTDPPVTGHTSARMDRIPPGYHYAMFRPGEGNANAGSSHSTPRRIVSLSGNRVRLDAREWPLVGSPNARLIFAEMFDYTCPHCRANHKFVKEAMKRAGNDVAMLALAVPLNAECNSSVRVTEPAHADACKLARLSVAVWRVDPDRFHEFHDWLFTGTTAPRANAALSYAENLVGKDKLQEELSKPTAGQYVEKQVKLYQMLGSGNVPKLIFPGTTVTGTVASADTMAQIIQQQTVLQGGK